MKANKSLFVSARVDKETKEWIENHLLSTSNLINYGLYLIRMMEKNVGEANIYITAILIEFRAKERLPF